MRASEVRVRDLEDYEACSQAREDIERDPVNTLGGYKAWTRGHQTYLTVAAENKLAAIERRAEEFADKAWADF